MELQLSLWNIHDWLDDRSIEHFYTLEDDLPLFRGVRFRASGVDEDTFAVLYDVTDNKQYRSVLSFQNGRIYFRFLPADEAMNLMNDLLFVYSDWVRKLTAANLSHAGLEKLLEEASSLFSLPMIVIRNNTVEARTKTFQNWTNKRLESLFSDQTFLRSCCEALGSAKKTGGVLFLKMEKYGQFLFKRIPYRDQYVILLAEAGDKTLTQADVLLFTQICHAVGIHLKNRSEVSGQDFTSSYFAFTSFAEGTVPSSDSLRLVLNSLGWQAEDQYQVICLQFKSPELQYHPDLLLTILGHQFPGSYTLVREDRLLLFLNISRCEQAPNESVFSERLPSDLLRIGQSNLHAGITDLPLLIRQAEQALLIARQTGEPFVNAQAISTQAVLKQFYSDSSLQAMVHPAILLLHELDQGKKTGFGYLKTLEVYLISGTNISAAARELHLHRNTFINRIERIKELTGLSLTDPKELEELLLSLIVFDRSRSEKAEN